MPQHQKKKFPKVSRSTRNTGTTAKTPFLDIELVLCLFWQKDYVRKMASASEEPDVSTRLMTKINVTIMDTTTCGENSVDKKKSNKGRKRIDGIKKSLTKLEREIIANGLIKKLEKQMNLGDLDKQMKGLEIKENEAHSFETTAEDLKLMDFMKNKKYISRL